MPAVHEPGDELLQTGGWSRWTFGALAVGTLVVVVALVVGLTRGGGHSSSAQHSSQPSGSAGPSVIASASEVAGNDVLVPGLWSRAMSGTTRHHIWSALVSAELINNRDQDFGIRYPIGVLGIDTGIELPDVRAMIATDYRSGMIRRPDPVGVVGADAHVEIWIELRVSCAQRRVSFRGVTVSIPLIGASDAATFSFSKLFNTPAVRRPQPC